MESFSQEWNRMKKRPWDQEVYPGHFLASRTFCGLEANPRGHIKRSLFAGFLYKKQIVRVLKNNLESLSITGAAKKGLSSSYILTREIRSFGANVFKLKCVS